VSTIAGARLILGDALPCLAEMPDDSFDLAIGDPPYGASTNASWALPAEHGLAGFGGQWRLADHDWDRLVGGESFRFTLAWLAELKRIVRPAGSIWIHATYHNAGFVNVACQLLGLEIINEVVWFKRNAFPNLSARRLTASHETLLWVHTGGDKRHYRFNYDAVKEAAFAGDQLKVAGRQLRTVWDVPNNKSRDERAFGSHPTQKPLRLTSRLFTIAGTPGGSALVPFMGSGSEVVAALDYGMQAVGVEIDPDWFDLATRRVQAATAHPRCQ
jgi:site-specific DNA-methyltransferase (adenine-specific)